MGFYTLLASELVGPAGKVFAFKPVPRNLSYLKEHLRLNSAANVSVIEAAVTDGCGSACFDESPGSMMGHIAAKGRLVVDTVSLDRLIEEGRIPTPDYIKIDVEGAEMMVLSGAESILAEARPCLFLATHGRDVHGQCCSLLRALNYTLRPIGEETVDDANEILAY